MATPRRSADEDIDNAPKRTKIGEVTYTHTDIEDIFTVEEPMIPSSIKENLTDWDSPVVIVVTKKTRDSFFKFLKNFENISNTDCQDSVPSTPTALDNVVIKDFEKNYSAFITQLNSTTNKYSDKEMAADLAGENEFYFFKEIRKHLTTTYLFAEKTKKAITLFRQGTKDHICTITPNLIPNRFGKHLLDTQLKKLHDCNIDINTTLLNDMVRECQHKVEETAKFIADYEDIIVAKAWRAVRKYNSISSYRTNTGTSQSYRTPESSTLDKQDSYLDHRVSFSGRSRVRREPSPRPLPSRSKNYDYEETEPQYRRRPYSDRQKYHQYSDRRRSSPVPIPSRSRINYESEDEDDRKRHTYGHNSDRRTYEYNYEETEPQYKRRPYFETPKYYQHSDRRRSSPAPIQLRSRRNYESEEEEDRKRHSNQKNTYRRP